MRAVELQILSGGTYRAVDINKNATTGFNFTLQEKDITNPTAIKFNFSVKIALPKTQLNTQIFSYIGELDAVIFNFDPQVRTPFRLYINFNLFQEGYIKIENITHKEYNIRLFGGLRDYFHVMNEIKLRELYDDSPDYFNHIVNATNIYDAISGRNITPNGDLLYALTYQGLYSNFDSSNTIRNGEASELVWIDLTGNKEYAQAEPTEHGRQYRTDNNSISLGEYRSYNQKPIIKFSTLYQHILDRLQNEGWKTLLDETFFNENNPYWNDLWTLFPNYGADYTQETNTPIYLNLQNSEIYVGQDNALSFNQSIDLTGFSDINLNKKVGVVIDFDIALLASSTSVSQSNIPNGLTKSSSLSLYGSTTLSGGGVVPPGSSLRFNDEVTLSLDSSNVLTMDFNNATKQNFYYKLKPIDADDIDSESSNPNLSDYSIIKCRGYIEIEPNTITSLTQLLVSFTLLGNSYWQVGSDTYQFGTQIQIQNDYRMSIISFNESDVKAKGIASYKDIVRSEYTAMQFLLSYNKLFDLRYIKDAARKIVRIVTRNTYYKDKETRNWTKKIDYSKDFIIEPVPFNYRYGVFKWDGLDTKHEEQYRSKYSREYGSFRFDNSYEFSDEEKNYLENNIFNNCVIASDYSHYYIGKNGRTYKDNKELPHLQDNLGTSPIDISMILLFKENLTSTGRFFTFTDDTPQMYLDGYTWNDAGSPPDAYYTSLYTKYTRIIQKNGQTYSLNFGRPQIAYNDTEADIINKNEEVTETIYHRFWQSYLQDIFDKNSKKLTCYVVLSNVDMQEDLFNKFIYINNTVWVINKIYQFNPLTHTPTKVELIKVQNINNYVSQLY